MFGTRCNNHLAEGQFILITYNEVAENGNVEFLGRYYLKCIVISMRLDLVKIVTYFDGCLHDNCCSIVDAFCA